MWASWQALGDGGRKVGHELLVPPRALLRGSHPLCLAQVGIGQAFFLGLCQCGLLDQHALSLVSVPRSAPLQHHRREPRVLPRSPRQGRVAARQVPEVIEVGALKAEGLSVFESDEAAPSQLLVAAIALGVAASPEDDDVLALPG